MVPRAYKSHAKTTLLCFGMKFFVRLCYALIVINYLLIMHYCDRKYNLLLVSAVNSYKC